MVEKYYKYFIKAYSRYFVLATILPITIVYLFGLNGDLLQSIKINDGLLGLLVYILGKILGYIVVVIVTFLTGLSLSLYLSSGKIYRNIIFFILSILILGIYSLYYLDLTTIDGLMLFLFFNVPPIALSLLMHKTAMMKSFEDLTQNDELELSNRENVKFILRNKKYHSLTRKVIEQSIKNKDFDMLIETLMEIKNTNEGMMNVSINGVYEFIEIKQFMKLKEIGYYEDEFHKNIINALSNLLYYSKSEIFKGVIEALKDVNYDLSNLVNDAKRTLNYNVASWIEKTLMEKELKTNIHAKHNIIKI